MANIINFNGTNYNSVDDMPPDVRQAYEALMGAFADQNHDGVPDAFEALLGSGRAPLVQAQTTIMFNGQAFKNVDELPPEARSTYAQMQGQYDANRNGMPDMIESMFGGPAAPPAAADPRNAPAFAGSPPIAPSVPGGKNGPSPYAGSVVSPEAGDNRLRLAVLAVVAMGVMACALGLVAVWALLR